MRIAVPAIPGHPRPSKTLPFLNYRSSSREHSGIMEGHRRRWKFAGEKFGYFIRYLE